ncbi:MAG: lysylphosphatidylglycerol synthase transmembrane domain-containing protein, partial [Tepidisphaeraceae bacterium]
ILLYVGYRQHVLDKLRQVAPSAIAGAAGLLAIAWLINSVRWAMLLRVAGIKENAAYLASLYYIGMFFSQILPTGAGGDAVRMLELYRRGHRPAPVVVATLQERLLGMGVSMLVGLMAAAAHLTHFPAAVRPILIGLPLAAIAAVAIFLYPRLPLGVAAKMGTWPVFRGLKKHPILHRLTAAIEPAAQLPPLTPARLVPILLVTLAGVLFSISVWWALGLAVGTGVGFGGFCLVIPLVWVIAMTPSLGGAGVREGGFVWLMGMFAVPTDRSLAVAALYLIVQLLLAAVGGVFLLLRIWQGGWKRNPEQSA